METDRTSQPSFSSPNMLVASPYMPAGEPHPDYGSMGRNEKSDLRVVPHFDNDRTAGYERRTPQSSPQIPRKTSASSPMSPRMLVKNIFGSKDKTASNTKDKENLYGSPKIGLMSDQDE
jgi:hypothetical protein